MTQNSQLTTQSSQLKSHTPHFYLAIATFGLAPVVCILDLWAYYQEGLALTHVAFAVVSAMTLLSSITWFWGVYLTMKGYLLRIGYLLVHAVLGSMIPCIYVSSLGIEVPTLSSQPIGNIEVYLSFLGILVIIAQVVLGRIIARVEGPKPSLRAPESDPLTTED